MDLLGRQVGGCEGPELKRVQVLAARQVSQGDRLPGLGNVGFGEEVAELAQGRLHLPGEDPVGLGPEPLPVRGGDGFGKSAERRQDGALGPEQAPDPLGHIAQGHSGRRDSGLQPFGEQRESLVHHLGEAPQAREHGLVVLDRAGRHVVQELHQIQVDAAHLIDQQVRPQIVEALPFDLPLQAPPEQVVIDLLRRSQA